jgi:predicted nucleic acid-binding protein
VKSFLDTSVLVAAFHVEHPHHEPSFDLFVRCQKVDACCGLHSLAEVYGTLTGMRVASRRASGDQALLFIGNICERLSIVGLNEQEYFQALEASAAAGIVGGAIYDSILGHCALKAGAETIYTWNTKDFLSSRCGELLRRTSHRTGRAGHASGSLGRYFRRPGRAGQKSS